MSRIIFVPVERLEQRYTGMVYDALAPHCDIIIGNQFDRGRIKQGQFLDVCGTIYHKSAQLLDIAAMFDNGDIKDGDIFLVGDIFFPGIESIKYMAELLGIYVKIVAFNHAGRADETDFVQRLGAWSDHSEKGWHDACDLILCGSEFHRKRVIAYFKLPLAKVVNSQMPWMPEWCESVHPKGTVKKDDYVIWPHRLCFEKGVDVLYRYAMQTARKIYITSCGKRDKACEQFEGMENVFYLPGLTKKEYYSYLDGAKYYLSTARQETFGYTLQEAMYYKCIVVAPNAACYNEYLPMCSLYDTADMLDAQMDWLAPFPDKKVVPLENNIASIMDIVKSVNH